MQRSNLVSIVIPTFNGAKRIEKCLAAIERESLGHAVEVIVVNDGSTDDTSAILRGRPGVCLIEQANAGPAAARNRGAQAATGDVIVFTDDDCIAAPGWLDAMLEPFGNADVVAVKGRYLTHQKGLVARFVQLDYEDRYRLSERRCDIDFIDTYSAAFRRTCFQALNGYDTSFPVACAEDAELSYRMAAKGGKMRFARNAIVYHQHPDSLKAYLKKKFKFAYWRVLAVSKNPTKAVRDSHTPQTMKLQLLFLPSIVCLLPLDIGHGRHFPATLVAFSFFMLSALPFTVRAVLRDPVAGLVSPVLLALRACAQILGVVGGTANLALHRRESDK